MITTNAASAPPTTASTRLSMPPPYHHRPRRRAPSSAWSVLLHDGVAAERDLDAAAARHLRLREVARALAEEYARRLHLVVVVPPVGRAAGGGARDLGQR